MAVALRRRRAKQQVFYLIQYFTILNCLYSWVDSDIFGYVCSISNCEKNDENMILFVYAASQ